MKVFLERFQHFKEEEIQYLLDNGKRKTAEEKEQLFLAEQVFSSLWFIEDGLVRAYRIIDGKDYTYFFFTANQFAVDYQSYLTGQPSPLFFETLAPTTYLEFSKTFIEEQYQRYPNFERLGRVMAEEAYLSAAYRLKEFQTDDLGTRYSNLIDRNPALFQKVPQHYIATYLGVKPQSLSRIRAKLLSTERSSPR